MNEVTFDFPSLQFDRVEGKSNKNIWLPSDVTKFVKIQLALDERPTRNKARQNDVVMGLVALGYGMVNEWMTDERVRKLVPEFEVKKLHTRESEGDSLFQYSLKLTKDCKDQLKKVVEWVESGDLAYNSDADFNESDALINLCKIAISSII